MSEKNKAPSGLAIWLGLAESSFQKQKRVRFGDASTVTGGRIWSILAVLVLGVLWTLSGIFKWTDPIFWPSPQAVLNQFATTATEGYRYFTLWQHIGYSVFRVLAGVFFGCLVGIPLGFAMGLSTKLRGIFDPIVEFMRPIPPLALIPLVVLWFGIGEKAKIILLFLTAVFIMTIAARSGVSSVKISKVYAAYSLGATKWQVLRYVILPNALPEIFTGVRTAMGVCWATVIAAELVAANVGIGFMIMVAANFLSSDLVVMGIIIIGVIGFGIEIAMRLLEGKLIPWKGKG
ncbi:MAG: ABC transporter permease subunit [Deltaproteobacteria bacterium]|nr:ABC transporter permease subunit [Deltaproteobacteria bacterium]